MQVARDIPEKNCHVKCEHLTVFAGRNPTLLEYELRPRIHDRELVPKVNSLTESNFLIRQLYKNCY